MSNSFKIKTPKTKEEIKEKKANSTGFQGAKNNNGKVTKNNFSGKSAKSFSTKKV